ncbi:DAK2 domain-containing protein [Ureaplasma canigenitalium]|uniref:DAK2 domain-containing protein n=1 Tax=Ureaplasma canigenitalium TaxID=42092 RepID=UPI0004E10E90|nr:DAK2 domain-containing protein [Ureaplasma canigenitalium]
MKQINLDLFIKMLRAGAKTLEINSDYINELNVFPVPDGDTGTNMKTTMNGALSSLKSVTIDHFKDLSKHFNRGLLMNARGNSGVILSQIFRGFLEALESETKEVSLQNLIDGFDHACQRAYNSVSNPVEGTILTIVRMTNDEIKKHGEFESIDELFLFALAEANNALEQTPELLPSLKEAGVVDSGGYALICVLQGMYEQLIGQFDESTLIAPKESAVKSEIEFINPEIDKEVGFGYCSEIVMTLKQKIVPDGPEKSDFSLGKYKMELIKFGDSLVVIQDQDIVKVHLHTTTPHKLLLVSQKYGEFDKIKFENMTNQFYENMERKGVKVKPNNNGELSNIPKIIVTVPSESFKKMFLEELGIEHIIVRENDGNPSIEQFVNKINECNSKYVYIITDDSNIIMAAEQAAKIAHENKILVNIIPAKNVFETLVTTFKYDPTIDYIANLKQMNKAYKKAKSALISKSVRDIHYGHINVKTGDYIGIINKTIVVSTKEQYETLLKTIELLISTVKKPEILYIYYGLEANLSDLHRIEKYVSEKYGFFCEIRNTKQSVYQYYIGVQ